MKTKAYFWKDKQGNKLSLKEFFKRWGNGIASTTPLQQIKITLWSFTPLFAGMIWGIAITFIGGTYWLTLILCGSLPITSIQFISNIQKFKALKKVDALMKEANK